MNIRATTPPDETPVPVRHTPGPWVSNASQSKPFLCPSSTGNAFWANDVSVRTADNKRICDVSHVTASSDVHGPAASYCGAASWEQSEANARLIAAAPELLDALETALSLLVNTTQAANPEVSKGIALLLRVRGEGGE